ncbi:hypothetical protein IJ579_09455 [bacterium]|nr:hypothetical protein [bacterium]
MKIKVFKLTEGTTGLNEKETTHPNPPYPWREKLLKILKQPCIQAHTSSLRCGGSLCKVQDDKFSGGGDTLTISF